MRWHRCIITRCINKRPLPSFNKKIICIERNPVYLELGKKLVQTVHRTFYEAGEEKTNTTEVIWINGDLFDENLWKQIEQDHGKIDCIISNPPYGKVTKTDFSRDWLKYKGAELEMAAIEIGILKSEYPSYIIPQGSTTLEVLADLGLSIAKTEKWIS